MTTARAHYDRLLATHYTWMLGGDIHAVARDQAALLQELGIRPGADGDTAVDLGSGPGPQTLALAHLGFSTVTAVDLSRALLDELAEHAETAGFTGAVRTVLADVLDALPHVAGSGTAAAIVCMGDTLTHLPSPADVRSLLDSVTRALRPGGHFVVTFRDLTGELSGDDRFLPVRCTEDQLLTCFLEYVDDDTVMVHDLLHSRSEGEWRLQVGSYRKLRLASEWLSSEARRAGLQVRHACAGPRGMRILHAIKPPEGDSSPTSSAGTAAGVF
ncbi:SAM-dependent methyltransferase [Streptomyces sp. PvR006]|uniref:class I SAM-dependent methyltransferase n=1 Tax=Streptomyces sp. PvR006 TaxID=2817860 RepID=UPI001AE8A03C|nr:class I SAM-dependent methyltransferase [Streptomyces sp. PvR006]MBP2586718.1 SAM-dependent methyltransferase [Streptomyces sp. PvR006]